MRTENFRRIARGYSPVEPTTSLEKVWYLVHVFLLAAMLLVGKSRGNP